MYSVHIKTKKNNKKIKLLTYAFTAFIFVTFSIAILEYTDAINLIGTSESPDKIKVGEKQKVANVDGQLDSPDSNSETTQQSDQQTTLDTGTPSKKTVVPVVSQYGNYGNQIIAAGFVPDIFEDGGSCTYTFNNDSTTFERTTSGSTNVSDTTCASITLDKTLFANGDWTVSLSYQSSAVAGISMVEKFNVKQ